MTGGDHARSAPTTLRFGTAGLRGPLRPGPDGMNVTVVSAATDGLARWLTAHDHAGGVVVVGRDARHGSEEFAAVTAQVLAAAGFDVVALPEPGPTPLVAFACRDLHAVAGVQITASHNPATDNGYKVYLDGGAQLIPPADREIEALIATAHPPESIARQPVRRDSRAAGIVDRYLDRCAQRFGTTGGHVRIALTALHGVGGELAVAALARCGFTDVHVVSAQQHPDPDFPTAAYPNPEEAGTTDALLALAADVGADLAIALDPDADRCAVGARFGDNTDAATGGNDWRMLTGDETGGLLGAYLLAHTDLDAPVVASTLVSGTMLAAVAARAGARHVTTRTGFKWLVRAGEPLLYAYEEAIGHCVDPEAVADKDGISAAVALAGLTAAQRAAGGSVATALADLVAMHGEHVTTQRSVRCDDAGQITARMRTLRTDPPTVIAGIDVTASDFADRDDELATDAVELAGTGSAGIGLRILARPSGTEPKLKFYVELTAPPGYRRPDSTDSAETAKILQRWAQRAADDVAATNPEQAQEADQ